MNTSELYLLAADAILVLHLSIAAFIVIGLLLIFLGKACGWSWVCNPWFRLAHIIAIGVVTLQSWFGVMCPLTTWEKTLRTSVGDSVYPGSFISHILGAILYYDVPSWVFTVCYTAFGAIVVASWVWARPRPFTKQTINQDNRG